MVVLRFPHPQPMGHPSTRITGTQWSKKHMGMDRIKYHQATLQHPTELQATAMVELMKEIREMATRIKTLISIHNQ